MTLPIPDTLPDWSEGIIDEATTDDLIAIRDVAKLRDEKYPLTHGPLTPQEAAAMASLNNDAKSRKVAILERLQQRFVAIQSEARDLYAAIETEKYAGDQSVYRERDYAEAQTLIAANRGKGPRETAQAFTPLIETALRHGDAPRAKVLLDAGAAIGANLGGSLALQVAAAMDTLPHRVEAEAVANAIRGKVADAQIEALRVVATAAQWAGDGQTYSKATTAAKMMLAQRLGTGPEGAYREARPDPLNIAGVPMTPARRTARMTGRTVVRRP